MPARQQLLSNLTDAELNTQLDLGARIVWMERDHERYNVVLETTVDPDVLPELIVLDFLMNVPEPLLERKMLEGADLNTGVARSALNALASMVKVPGG